MELTLYREPSVDGCTFGRLFINGTEQCFSLEDEVRAGPKVYGETAIPAGRYQVVISKSKRFGKMLPLLLNVPGFDGIRIYSGNNIDQTAGCLLVGRLRDGHQLLQSRAALEPLMGILAAAQAKGERMWITVINPSKDIERSARMNA
jgi:hypothetical protein